MRPRAPIFVLFLTLPACSDDGGGGPRADAADAGPDTGPDAEPDGGDGGGEACSCEGATLCDDDENCVAAATVMVPMDDGVRLSTFVVLPDVVPPGGVGTVLDRTPYGFPDVEGWPELWETTARYWASRGYAAIVQDVRGRGRSEGDFHVFRDEMRDGRSTTAWIVEQPWSNGRVGTVGGSYDGFAAIAAAVDNPDVVAVVADDPAEDERSSFEGGVLNTNLLSWLYLTDHGDFPAGDEADVITNALDLPSLDVAILGREDAYWDELVAFDAVAPFPSGGTLDEVYEQLCAPVFLVYSSQSGWWDAVRIWDGLEHRGCAARRADHRLVLTPEGHTYHLGQLLGGVETPVNHEMLDAMDHFLGEDEDVGVEDLPPVQVWLADDPEPRAAEDWTGPGVATFYLGNGGEDPTLGALGPDAPPDDEAPDVLALDPETQDPCLGETPSAVYTSERLGRTLTIVGSPTVTLVLDATTPDVDAIATLYEVRGDDWEVIGWGAQRARFRTPGAAAAPLEPGATFTMTVRLQPTTQEVEAASHLVLYVTGAECGFIENPHTGEPAAAQTHRAPTVLSIHHGAAGVSSLELPTL